MSKNKTMLFLPFVIIALLVVGILISDDPTYDPYDAYDLEGLSNKALVEKLESTTINPDELIASITSDTLYLTTQEQTYTHDLSDEDFYLSFAPYINHTHPCGNHNLTTCRGELKNETFIVLIETLEGDVIFDGEITSEDNGFAGIWLPRDLDLTITVHYNDLVAQDTISTASGEDTCLTTLPLT